MFKGLAVRMAQYLRIEKEAGGPKAGNALANWEDVHSFYFDMPKKAQFAAVTHDHFYLVKVRAVSLAPSTVMNVAVGRTIVRHWLVCILTG